MAAEGAFIDVSLSVPTEEEAQQYLNECDFDDRIVGVIMKASGTLPIDMYSLEHVLGFFAHDNSDTTGRPDAVIQERQLDIAYVVPERLARWIRMIVGDTELAAAIDAEVAKIEDPNIYPPRMRLMRELVVSRVLQCYDVLGIELETGESATPESGDQREQEGS